MPAINLNISARVKTINAVLHNSAHQKLVNSELQKANGNWDAALLKLKDKLPASTFQKVSLAHSIAVMSDDHLPLVKAIVDTPDLTSLRDVALNFNVESLAAHIDLEALPDSIAGENNAEKLLNFAVTVRHKLFNAEPTAVLQRMVFDAEVPITNLTVRTGVVSFLNNQSDYNIRTTSIYTALKKDEAFKGIADEHRADVVTQLKTLQRVQAMSPVPEAVPMMMKAGLTSAFEIGEMPESTFMSAFGKSLGEEHARQLYTKAINIGIRNEQTLMTLRDATFGASLAIIDGTQDKKMLMSKAQSEVDKHSVPLNLEELFGSIDFCECGECNSVYSPAGYFVELLQYLRNNNLDPDNPNINKKDIAGTPLEKLFRRRPDLGCLELTCENTNTVLPYIDLVNEVMESFVVHQGDYHASTTDPKQAKLDVFNVEDETSSELLAQPQHTNYEAYCILKNAVYPFTLPYHQPIDAIRIFLNYLGTSKHELIDTYRSACEICNDPPLCPADQKELEELHMMTLDRAADAEFLGLTQEEYIILTKEALWPKRYFDITLKKNHTDDEYRQKIGVKHVHEYYGYETEADMLSSVESQKKGLTFVKKQFLPRTGILYVDLVELLKTRCINPNYPQGKALTLLESIRFSYLFLQTLVDKSSTDPKIRFAKLIEFLEKTQSIIPLVDSMLHPDPCKEQKSDRRVEVKDLRNWVYCWFEKIGKLIVLESGEGPRLPIEGRVFRGGNTMILVGTLHTDGTIVDQNGEIIANVTLTGQVIATDGELLIGKFGGHNMSIRDANNRNIGYIDKDGIRGQREERLTWLPAQETCNLTKVRLKHLDASPVTTEEYDCMQRFIRLWRKIGWTIDEIDKALLGLATRHAEPNGENSEDDCHYTGFETFRDDCHTVSGSGEEEVGGEDDICRSEVVESCCEITPELLHQLPAVKKLMDMTGLPLPKLLSFWTKISTAGEKSLYSKLFLTHNMLGIDKVFKADKDGNYLTRSAKISNHLPVLMAAFKLKAEEITAIMEYRHLTDDLTLANVSTIYRHSLLAKFLHIKTPQLAEVIGLFGDPFISAHKMLELIETWGRMEEAGFNFRQLNYVIKNHDDLLRPLAPKKRTILQLTKTLYDGLNAIDSEHRDLKENETDKASADLVRTKAGMIFEPSVVDSIIGLLEGTTVYATNAPANLTIEVPESLAKKLKYSNQKNSTPPRADIQVTGILTEAEQTLAKSLSSDSKWSESINRIGKKRSNFFTNHIFGIFADQTQAKDILLAGDVPPADKPEPLSPDPNTAPVKRFYFLRHFMPFLRRRLAQRLIVDTMSGATGIANEVTHPLLTEILKAGTPPQFAIDALEKIKVMPVTGGGSWKGYLIPSIEESFTFIGISDTRPTPLLLDGNAIAFPYQQEDPNNVWSSDPVKLKAGKLYWLEVSDRPASELEWKTAASPKAKIPSAALLPDYSAQGTEEVFIKLYKAAILINGFGLTVDEVSYLQSHGVDFDGFDFNSVSFQQWKRLESYITLRNSLPKLEMTLLELFNWASKTDLKPENAARLSEKIAEVTGWKKERIDKLLALAHFNLNRPQVFRNEVNLVKLQSALRVADKIGIDIDRLFEWAKPGSKFWACHKIAEDIRKTVRARFDQEDWEQVVKPLNNQLRENQKQALISYLLVQKDLIDWGVTDADGLFEFFLIDVQMSDCMETSRIKQALSTVQVFVQRCFLGLEEKYGIPNEVLDRKRWDWMSRYRIWEANRKVFLYPENWILSNLRDDKSPFYKELESELLQKDINQQTVEEALKNYLYKVDEVANLKVVGLFLDKERKKLHIFSRTRNAPYFFYYRFFDTGEKNWYPWEKVQVDIPSYDMEDSNGKITGNGTYLIPVVWNNRLLIFFPQFAKKTAPNPDNKDKNFHDIANKTQDAAKPIEFWEIKMGWSEYRNGKWTQKQVTTEAFYDPASLNGGIPSLSSIDSYEFIPSVGNKIDVDIYRDKPIIGTFSFSGSILGVSKDLKMVSDKVFDTIFHYNITNSSYVDNIGLFSQESHIYSLQEASNSSQTLFNKAPNFQDLKTRMKVTLPDNSSTIGFWHPFAHTLLEKITSGSLDDLFDYYLNKVNNNDKDDAFGAYTNTGGAKIYNELKQPYSLYNWEAAFHTPMVLTEALLKSQHFDQALKMCHYVFNPMAKGLNSKRYWQFWPFRKVDAENVLEKLFMSLKPNEPDTDINEWRNKPFQPHVIARSRPSAYMKWTVMKYIEILIAYGDYYFRQFTLESLPLAIQCYVVAAHIYGTKGQKIPRRGKIEPQTYKSLLDKWDAFGNAKVELELVFPYSNQTPLPIGMSNGVVGLSNVFGFATSLYFCIPDNPKLRSLRDTIDDRLFKIRHCQDIEGIFRKLPLFEPPIDPALLVQAVAQGLSLASVLNDLNSPMPNYRFQYLLQKALELTSELKSMGNTHLSLKEKIDGEVIAKLRAKHESIMNNLVMEMKKKQLEEAQSSLEALHQSRNGPVYRLQHFLKLIGEDLKKIPAADAEFVELQNQIEKPVAESGLKLSNNEKMEMDEADKAHDWQDAANFVEASSAILHALPDAVIAAMPFGIGGQAKFGGSHLGNAATAASKVLQIFSSTASYKSSGAARKGGFQRQLQDRIQQANIAGYECKNIDKQILTQTIRIQVANQDITNQQKLLDNSREVEEFLRNKYTNEELYSWMEGELKTLYYQAYTLAYEWAKKAEKIFRFERGLNTSNYIQFGYWDTAHDGLLAGERLYLGLKQLEAAYQEKRGYDFEVSKHISLRQVNPLALIQLKESGRCEFSLPEVLFDMDYPGHYMRRIKSVALTIPCVVGPYTGLSCTLRLLENKFRISAIAKGKNDYFERIDETDDRFSTVNVPITSIASSTGQNDSGVFDLNFRDERYIPFEGAGAISKWRLELPSQFRQFDYDTISDVILNIRYTSIDGGDKLKKAASDSMVEYIKNVEELSRQEGLFAMFDLTHDFPTEWYKAMQPLAGATERTVMLNALHERLPIFTKGRKTEKIQAADIYLFTSAAVIASDFIIMQNSEEQTFEEGTSVDGPQVDGRPVPLKSFVSKGISNFPINSWQLKIKNMNSPIDKLWMVIRYVLT